MKNRTKLGTPPFSLRSMSRSLLAVGTSALATLGAASAQFEQTTVDTSAFSLGTLTPAGGAFERSLWAGSDRATVSTLLEALPSTYATPVDVEILRRVTLSPGDGPRGADNALAAQKFMAAAHAGFYDDAASLAQTVPGLRTEPGLSKVVAFSNLMDGSTDEACARGAGLRDGRTDPFWIKLRFICYVRTGETSAAELTLDLLRRQQVLTSTEDDRFGAFLRGRLRWRDNAVPYTPFDIALLRELEAAPSAKAMEAAPLGIVAAVARDLRMPESLREAALLRSLRHRTISVREGRRLLETMPTTPTAVAIVGVAAQSKGSLEQYEAIGEALTSVGDDWSAFTARALLLTPDLPTAEPIVNYAVQAGEIALAGMITGQDGVVDKWLLALASDTMDPSAQVRAADLVGLYGLKDPGAARRLSSYLGFALVTPQADGMTMVGEEKTGTDETALSLPEFVSAGLNAAGTDGVGPAALVYLLGTNVGASDDEEAQRVRQIVREWAMQRADLDWGREQAAFEAGGATYLATTDWLSRELPAAESGTGGGNGGASGGGGLNELPRPRVKPE